MRIPLISIFVNIKVLDIIRTTCIILVKQIGVDMPKVKIREDDRGSYFVADGTIIRPVYETSLDTNTTVDTSQCK